MENLKNLITEWKDLESHSKHDKNNSNHRLKETGESPWGFPWNDLTMSYMLFSGMDDGVYDKRCFSFWTVDRSFEYLKNSKFSLTDFWLFADYGYELNMYALNKKDIPNYGIYAISGNKMFRCSENLNDFFGALQSDPEKLHIFCE